MSDFKLTTTIGAAERLRDKPLEDVLAGMDTEWEGLRHDLHAEVKHWHATGSQLDDYCPMEEA